MRKTVLFIGMLASCIANVSGQGSASQPRRYMIGNSEIREIHSAITHEDYELIIGVPYSYGQDTLKKYPVVYFCDGYYDFALLAMIYGGQIYDQTMRECFLVGFSYKGAHPDYGKLRAHDYTPSAGKPPGATGGADDFLKVVEQEFIPFMEKNYRVDPGFRALGGSSLGGLFTLYAMFTRTSLFNSYIAISPAADWNNDWLFRLEEEYRTHHSDLPVSLFMTGAEKEIAERPEFLLGIKQLDRVLAGRSYKGFRYRFRLLDDAYHSGSKPEGFARGMKFIFEPMMKQ